MKANELTYNDFQIERLYFIHLDKDQLYYL